MKKEMQSTTDALKPLKVQPLREPLDALPSGLHLNLL